MHTKHPLIMSVLTLFAVYLCAIPSTSAGADRVLPMHGRVLSLRVLQERIQECQPHGNCDEVVLHLAGLKRIHGYVVDEENHDLVLIGQVEPSAWPALHLQDLVIALRDAWKCPIHRRSGRVDRPPSAGHRPAPAHWGVPAPGIRTSRQRRGIGRLAQDLPLAAANQGRWDSL